MIAILTPITIGLISMAKTVASQGIEIMNLKNNQFENNLKSEKNFDKLEDILYKQTEKLEQVRILLENKENRK